MGNSWDIPPGYVNIAIEMAIYSGFIHQKWWCSIVFCMFTRGYHGPWYTSCWYHWVFKMTTMDTVRVPSMYPKLVSCNIMYDYIPLSKIWMWLYIPLGTCGHLCDMYVYIYNIHMPDVFPGTMFWRHILAPCSSTCQKQRSPLWWVRCERHDFQVGTLGENKGSALGKTRIPSGKHTKTMENQRVIAG